LNAAITHPGTHDLDTRSTKAIALVCRESQGEIDGIRDYTVQLADALGQLEGVSAEVLGPGALNGALVDYDAVVLQYNPFMYGRWGFAPWLPAALLRTRRRHPTLEIALMVHEPYVPMINWRWTLMGIWQRSQLFALRAVADPVFASIDAWTSILGEMRPRKAVYHLPVGSNLPDRRPYRKEARLRIGATPETLIISTFGTAHPARRVDYVVAAVNAIAVSGVPTILLNLGAGTPAFHGVAPSVRLLTPGVQSAPALAEFLSATDIFLAPFIDGVSTRRTTVMAALQHGLAVIGTDGPLTDPGLRASDQALRLVPVAREDLFVDAALKLASRREEREQVRRAARRLYQERFDWPIIAEALLSHLSPPRTPAER
jgi:glycosyltransferase involved in cell wall biosynthesis